MTTDDPPAPSAPKTPSLSPEIQEAFISVLGHDLRGPLSSITMNAGLLLDSGKLDDRQLRMMGRIARSAERMNRMIRDLLDFTLTRAGGGFELLPSTFDLADVCEEVVEESRRIDPQRTLTLSVSARARGTWDADRIAQALSNLLSNAIRYSPADTAVRIWLGEVGPDAVIEVKNAGEPIPAGVLSVILEPYARVLARGPTGSVHGLGLGVYLAGQIAAAHGGRIEARSSAEEGTTFRIVLPRGPR
jgi:signal transduction histidine kinase